MVMLWYSAFICVGVQALLECLSQHQAWVAATFLSQFFHQQLSRVSEGSDSQVAELGTGDTDLSSSCLSVFLINGCISSVL